MIAAGLYLADTSAVARIARDAVHTELNRLGRLGLLATCVTIDLEIGYSARDPESYRRTAQLRSSGFVDLPLHPEIGRRALRPPATAS